MTIGQFAEHVGLSTSTLRYYERVGLLPEVARSESGHRAYDPDMQRWIRFLVRLRSTRMPIRDVKRYVDALKRGPAGDEHRMELLRLHAERIREDMGVLEDCLGIVEQKLANGCRPRAPDGRD